MSTGYPGSPCWAAKSKPTQYLLENSSFADETPQKATLDIRNWIYSSEAYHMMLDVFPLARRP